MLTLVRHFLSSVFFVFSGGREKTKTCEKNRGYFRLLMIVLIIFHLYVFKN